MIDEFSIAGIATFDVQPERMDALSQERSSMAVARASVNVVRFVAAILILASGFAVKRIAPRISDSIRAKSTGKPALLRGLKAKMRIAGFVASCIMLIGRSETPKETNRTS